MPKMLGITSCLDRFLKHNLVHGFFDTFFPITQAQSHYALYTLLDETEMTQNNSGFFFFCCSKNLQLQSWKTKFENWHEPSNKSEIIGFYMEKIADIVEVSLYLWSSYLSNRLFCCKLYCKTSVCVSFCRSRRFSCTSPMKLAASTSPLPSTSCSEEQSFQLLLNRCFLFFIFQLFCYICQIYTWLHHFFWFILTIHDSVHYHYAWFH